MSTEKTAEVALSSAIDKMIVDLTTVLTAKGIQVENNKIFDLAEHGIHDEHGKVRHSDSQKVLTDPQALNDYEIRSAKALWNFAQTLKKILDAEGLLGKAKLGLSLKDFLGDNILYLDSQHLDDSGKPIPNRNSSNAIIVVDSTTLGSAKIYHEFLVSLIANQQGLFEMLPWVVMKLVGSTLKSAIKAAEKITKSLNYRKSQFEKKKETSILPATSALESYERFFRATDQIQKDWDEINKNTKATPQQKLEFIKVSSNRLLQEKKDKETLDRDIDNMMKLKDSFSKQPMSELELDSKELTDFVERTIQTLRGYQDRLDQTLEQHEALLSTLKQQEEKINAEMNAGQRNTPMDQRPAALRATLVELNQQQIIFNGNVGLDEELNKIHTLLPLKRFVDSAATIKFPYPQDKLKELTTLLGLNEAEEKKFSLLSDTWVKFEDSKKKRQEAVNELIKLATTRLGVYATEEGDKQFSKLKALRGTASATPEDGQRIDSDIISVTKRLQGTLQQESTQYQHQVEPLLSSATTIFTAFDKILKDKNTAEGERLLIEAQSILAAIDQLSSDYDDCELDKTLPDLSSKIAQTRSKLTECHQQLELTKNKIALDKSQLEERKKLFIDYFGEKGKGTHYLDNREKKYKFLDIFQRNFSFFRPSGTETDSEKRGKFLFHLGNHIINYIDSGDKKHLETAIKKIDTAIATQQFPHRRSAKDYHHSMQALLESLRADIVKEQQNRAPVIKDDTAPKAQPSG